MDEAEKISAMECEENSEIFISKTRELLSTAQLLLREIEELVERCTLTGPSDLRERRTIQQPSEASIEEDGETLVIEGLRFESAASREELRKLSSKAGAPGHRGDT